MPVGEPNMQISEHEVDERFKNITVPTQPMSYTPDPPRSGLADSPEMR